MKALHNCMRIIRDGVVTEFHICTCCECNPLGNTIIQEFYSEKHAKDEGWVKTSHIKYCDPKYDYVWVCPECWNKDTINERYSNK